MRSGNRYRRFLSGTPPAPQEATAYIARLSAAPTSTERTAIVNLFRTLKTAGLLSVLDALYVGAATDTDSVLNILSTSATLTKANSPTWTKYRGYKGNGTNTSLDTGINTSTAPGLQYQKDSASLFAFVLSQPTNTGAVVGRNANPNYTALVPYAAGGKLNATVNGDAGGVSNSNVTNPIKNGLGFSAAVRDSSSTVKLYKDGVEILSASSSSVNIPNGTIRGLTGNGTFTDCELGAWGFGGAMTAAQVSALSAALYAYFTTLGQAFVDPATPYGIWRGTWNSGGNAISGSVVFTTRDVVFHSAAYYFCTTGYTTSGASSAPDVDTTNWEPLPLPTDTELFSDTFDSGAGTFNGRVSGSYTWSTTGAGYLNAQVVIPSDGDGYATSSLNTYYQMTGLASPPIEWGAVESDSMEPHFTLAIGGTDVANWDTEMVHLNFRNGIVDGRYWHDGLIGQQLETGAKFVKNDGAGVTLNAGQRYEVKVQVRGNFLFGFLDGALVYTVCNTLVGDIASVATQVYTQNQTQTNTGAVPYAFGDQKIYRVWCRAAV